MRSEKWNEDEGLNLINAWTKAPKLAVFSKAFQENGIDMKKAFTAHHIEL